MFSFLLLFFFWKLKKGNTFITIQNANHLNVSFFKFDGNIMQGNIVYSFLGNLKEK